MIQQPVNTVAPLLVQLCCGVMPSYDGCV